METVTLPPALREEDALISKSAAPKLTYRQAVDAYFVAGPGQICWVATCTTELFTALVERCICTAKNPKTCAGALAGLDYAESLSRWYSLDTLRVYGATVSLFSSMKEAEAAIQQEHSCR